MSEIRSEVASFLGPQFEAQNIDIRRGSVEVLIDIATVGVVYYAFSRYKSFVESLDLLAHQLGRVLARFSGPDTAHIRGGWIPSPALFHPAADHAMIVDAGSLYILLVGYLILTNTVLIGFVLWMLLRRY
ncbi:MAG: hypothetical protein HYY96_02830 [Candidatus Tectomicrobia bacterium]|nr:hypothetical protein [Candidatus Tectomicrobia bacterium]